MAKIYAKPSEQTLILSPREFMLRQFDLGAWNEIRVGFFLNCITAANDNATIVAETIALLSATDRFVLGIKNADTTSIPGQTGSQFLGVGNTSDVSVGDNLPTDMRLMEVSTGLLHYIATNDTTVTSAGTAPRLGFPANIVANSSNYNGFFGLKYTVANRGLSTQTVTITACNVPLVLSSTYSLTELRNQVTTFPSPSTPSTTIAWNNGTVAYPLPDCVFIRLPMILNRFRISAVDVIRIS